MPDSQLEHDTVRPTFKPPFDIIHALSADARAVEAAIVADSPDEKRAASLESARLMLLPRVRLELLIQVQENSVSFFLLVQRGKKSYILYNYVVYTLRLG